MTFLGWTFLCGTFLCGTFLCGTLLSGRRREGVGLDELEEGLVEPVGPDGETLGSGIVTGKRGVWSFANAGVQPNKGKRPPYPLMRNCWMMLKVVVVIQ